MQNFWWFMIFYLTKPWNDLKMTSKWPWNDLRMTFIKEHSAGFEKIVVIVICLAFLILLTISLAWVIFYYVQRFRILHEEYTVGSISYLWLKWCWWLNDADSFEIMVTEYWWLFQCNKSVINIPKLSSTK